MKFISFILNLPWTIIATLCAIISLPKRIRINQKPFAIVFIIRSFWWYEWLSKGVRAMALGNCVLLGPKELPNDFEHELAHIKQIEREPFVHFFLYQIETLRHGYRKNKYEEEAYSSTNSTYLGKQ